MSNGIRKVKYDPARQAIQKTAAQKRSIAEDFGKAFAQEQKEEAEFQGWKGMIKPLIDLGLDKSLIPALLKTVGVGAMTNPFLLALTSIAGMSGTRFLTDALYDFVGRDLFGGGGDVEDLKGHNVDQMGKKAEATAVKQLEDATTTDVGDRAKKAIVSGSTAYAGDELTDYLKTQENIPTTTFSDNFQKIATGTGDEPLFTGLISSDPSGFSLPYYDTLASQQEQTFLENLIRNRPRRGGIIR